MIRIVINRCWGGFMLSETAINRYAELKGVEPTEDMVYMIHRDDTVLVQVVEELGDLANGTYSNLKIVDIPDGVSWVLEDYDGMESIEEVHRSWC